MENFDDHCNGGLRGLSLDSRHPLTRSSVRSMYIYYYCVFVLSTCAGTNFCALAKDNLPKQAVPKYYCSKSHL
jgi:hypothetical protein